MMRFTGPSGLEVTVSRFDINGWYMYNDDRKYIGQISVTDSGITIDNMRIDEIQYPAVARPNAL